MIIQKEVASMTSRKKLKFIGDNERHTFVGTFERYGSKKNYHGFPETTILLKNIKMKDTKEIITDHLWFNFTKGFRGLGNMETGELIQFNARVKPYVKGYQGYREEIARGVSVDYKLSHPNKISRIIN